MLVGIELPPDRDERGDPRLTDADRAALLLIRPALVKVRFHEPEYLWSVADLLPGVQFLSRPESEGYSAEKMVEEYLSCAEGFTEAGLLDSLVGHEISNEPNHQDGPYTWHGAWSYSYQLDRALGEIGRPAVPLISPGLQPWAGTEDYAEMLYDRRGAFEFTGVHVYWQGDHVADGVREATNQAGGVEPGRVICTEFGDATESAPVELRAARDVQALQLMQDAGLHAASLFVLRAPGWERFALPAEWVKTILGSAWLPQEPDPVGPAVGPGIAAALARRGDVATTDEVWIGDILSVTRARSGRLYVYVKTENRVYVAEPEAA